MLKVEFSICRRYVIGKEILLNRLIYKFIKCFSLRRFIGGCFCRIELVRMFKVVLIILRIFNIGFRFFWLEDEEIVCNVFL